MHSNHFDNLSPRKRFIKLVCFVQHQIRKCFQLLFIETRICHQYVNFGILGSSILAFNFQIFQILLPLVVIFDESKSYSVWTSDCSFKYAYFLWSYHLIKSLFWSNFFLFFFSSQFSLFLFFLFLSLFSLYSAVW